jgi:hypothetical protein
MTDDKYRAEYMEYCKKQDAKHENADPYHLWLRKKLNPNVGCTKCRQKAKFLARKGVRLK